jgi:hypothetical protein
MSQLSSLALAVPWDRLKTAAAKLGRTGDSGVLQFLQAMQESCQAVSAHRGMQASCTEQKHGT